MTTTTPTHTPTLKVGEPGHGNIPAVCGNGLPILSAGPVEWDIAHVYDDIQDHPFGSAAQCAAMIVLAVNRHAELVATVKALLPWAILQGAGTSDGQPVLLAALALLSSIDKETP